MESSSTAKSDLKKSTLEDAGITAIIGVIRAQDDRLPGLSDELLTIMDSTLNLILLGFDPDRMKEVEYDL